MTYWPFFVLGMVSVGVASSLILEWPLGLLALGMFGMGLAIALNLDRRWPAPRRSHADTETGT